MCRPARGQAAPMHVRARLYICACGYEVARPWAHVRCRAVWTARGGAWCPSGPVCPSLQWPASCCTPYIACSGGICTSGLRVFALCLTAVEVNCTLPAASSHQTPLARRAHLQDHNLPISDQPENRNQVSVITSTNIIEMQSNTFFYPFLINPGTTLSRLSRPLSWGP
jgi:hypothetical protein